ncbi:inositol hexakisphosphate and diphosphoinositol-pentakisphosphate kinase 2 [Elysia marginata]|uniref:Inositol hexakisphosphate and diphosphoinositol-pentakisphosphate kinase 2 n=1 Tax=Elysia marginata TaxID=1093978 RepID=A0AAV4GN91_9GAST|nr:inositol hexakisphosphate and diphosphoinositol-pentakisphosphate kinase 2 [Elysia marginata]
MYAIFRDNGLNITIQANQKIVDFLDVTFNLHTGLHKPYKKLNDSITYIHKESNHPPSIIKNLPQGIEKSLTNNSSNEKIFEDAAIPYNEALKKNGHVMALKYAEKKTNTTTKNENKSKETANEGTKETKTTKRRKRRITWFNPPYSKNVSSNIGKKFFDLLNSCSPPNHKLHKIINKNTVKLSYSCMPNIKQIISSHNKRIINESSNKASTTKLCNCRDKSSCPLQGKCLEQSLDYRATVSETNTNKIDTYIGITENTFKRRFNQHMSSFRLHHKKSATALSEHVWKLKDNERDFKIS